MKPKLRIQRHGRTSDSIFGVATYTDKDNRICLQSIENNGTHIEAGTYKSVKTFSPRFGVDYYLIPAIGRKGIRIHPANWGRELEGCIALGISKKGDMITASKLALSHFHALSKGQELTIEIRDEETFRKALIKIFGQIVRSFNKRFRKTA